MLPTVPLSAALRTALSSENGLHQDSCLRFPLQHPTPLDGSFTDGEVGVLLVINDPFATKSCAVIKHESFRLNCCLRVDGRAREIGCAADGQWPHG